MQEDLFRGNKENAEDQTWRTQTSSEEGQNRIAVHAHETQHEINLDGTEVKKMEANYCKRRTFEAVEIKASSETMNLDSGLQLPSIWNPILNPH